MQHVHIINKRTKMHGYISTSVFPCLAGILRTGICFFNIPKLNSVNHLKYVKEVCVVFFWYNFSRVIFYPKHAINLRLPSTTVRNLGTTLERYLDSSWFFNFTFPLNHDCDFFFSFNSTIS